MTKSYLKVNYTWGYDFLFFKYCKMSNSGFHLGLPYYIIHFVKNKPENTNYFNKMLLKI